MSSSIITSIVTGGSNSHATVSEEANAIYTDFVTQGIVGTISNTSSVSPATGGFAVNQDASPDMGVTITAGVATITATPANQDSQVLRARMSANYTSYTINANSTGSTVYDWIYLKVDATKANNPAVAADDVTSIVTSRSTSQSTDNGTPPTYGVPLAVITIVNGATQILNANIRDNRLQSTLNVGTSSTNGWQTLPFPLTYSANNGNKEFTVTSPNDLTGTLSAGMKVKLSRSVTPPSQCMSFTAASSQYATKASPSGITFTSAFTCEAWIYLNSYTGNAQFIMGRSDNTTGGFAVRLSAVGQLEVFYGSSSSFTDALTYQSIPLKTWTHVAAVVSSVSSKTFAFYINGLSVPFSQSGTTTTLTQAGNLTLGSVSTGLSSTYFDGYISEARIWSVAQSASSIQSNMTINVSGSATNLVALFQGNGNFNDGTSNANNLTQSGGASATQAANPYNATEYAFVLKTSYSNPTTTVTLKAVGGTIPNMTLNNPYYSNVDMPFAWPSAMGSLAGHRLIWLPFLAAQTTTSTSQTAFGGSNSSWTFTVPQNCGVLRIKAFNTSNAGSSSVTGKYCFYNGSINNNNLLSQVNNTDLNSSLAADILIPVVPSSTITFNIGWNTTSGTHTWGANTTTIATDSGFWVEVA